MRAKEFIFEEDNRSPREKFLDRVIGPESGGSLGIRNKRSGAQGLFQFMPDTWKGVVKKAKPGDPHYGMSFDQMRHNEKAQRSAADQIAREYQAAIKRHGMPDTPTSYYLLHGHGPKGVEIFKNPDKQLKDIYPEYVRNKEGKMVKNIVYRQNPNFDPNQRLRDVVANTASKMGDKITDIYPGGKTQLAKNEPQPIKEPSTIDKVKKKVTDIGTTVLGTVVGAKDARAGELPADTKAKLQQPIEPKVTTQQPIEPKPISQQPSEPKPTLQQPQTYKGGIDLDLLKPEPKTYGAGYDPSKVQYAYVDGKPNPAIKNKNDSGN